MRYDYFHVTELDRNFYKKYLKDKLPDKFIDCHTHMNLREHL